MAHLVSFLTILIAHCVYVNGGYAIPKIGNFKSSLCDRDFEVLSDDCHTSLQCYSSGNDGSVLLCDNGYQFIKAGSMCSSNKSVECSLRENERAQTCSRLQTPSIPDSKFCHQYYDCTDPSVHKECTFPKLYSTTTHSCEDYSKVTCGSRLEFKSTCQYSPNLYAGSHHKPCEFDHPSCFGHPDGINTHPIEMNYPYARYMVCNDERLLSVGNCPTDRQRLSHPLSGVDNFCLDPQNINCGSSYGYYPTIDCDTYIWCYAGLKYIQRCPSGTTYDSTRKSCQHLYDVCTPCGTKQC